MEPVEQPKLNLCQGGVTVSCNYHLIAFSPHRCLAAGCELSKKFLLWIIRPRPGQVTKAIVRVLLVCGEEGARVDKAADRQVCTPRTHTDANTHSYTQTNKHAHTHRYTHECTARHRHTCLHSYKHIIMHAH